MIEIKFQLFKFYSIRLKALPKAMKESCKEIISTYNR